MSTGAFLPQIGELDPGALEYINSVWDRIPEHAMFRRHEAESIKLKDLIREEREAIRIQERFRRAIIAAVERETGVRYQRAEVPG